MRVGSPNPTPETLQEAQDSVPSWLSRHGPLCAPGWHEDGGHRQMWQGSLLSEGQERAQGFLLPPGLLGQHGVAFGVVQKGWACGKTGEGLAAA